MKGKLYLMAGKKYLRKHYFPYLSQESWILFDFIIIVPPKNESQPLGLGMKSAQSLINLQ